MIEMVVQTDPCRFAGLTAGSTACERLKNIIPPFSRGRADHGVHIRNRHKLGNTGQLRKRKFTYGKGDGSPICLSEAAQQ
jgi:hypothetical protein